MKLKNTESDTPYLNNYDVIIIGGGIIGCSTAYYHSKIGKRVLLLEKNKIASKQSGKAWGFVRKQMRSPCEIQLSQSSIELWKALSEDVYDISWRNTGGIQLIESEEDLEKYHQWMKAVSEYSISTRIIEKEEIKSILPMLKSSAKYAIYTKDDGQVNPYDSVIALKNLALRFGTVFQENIDIDEISSKSNNIHVSTKKGTFIGEQVVCCAGSGSYYLLKKLGINIPQLCARVTSFQTYPLPKISNATFLGGGIGFRQDNDGCITIGCQNETDIDLTWRYILHGKKYFTEKKISKHDLSINFKHLFRNEEKTEFMPEINNIHIHLAKKRFSEIFPDVEPLTVKRSWSEYIDFLPDSLPIIDRHPIFKNIVIATGFSGSGLALGPAVGKLVSDILNNKPLNLDITKFKYRK